jgi:hypothetical protein
MTKTIEIDGNKFTIADIGHGEKVVVWRMIGDRAVFDSLGWASIEDAEQSIIGKYDPFMRMYGRF